MREQKDIERKLSAARTRLIIDRPFLGALTLRLPMLAADASWCPTTATDAKTFYYNPAYIHQLSLSQTQFVLAHEALHCALSHFARRQHRAQQRWDIACDFAVNHLLVNDGLAAPLGILMETGFNGMTAEEIYPFIEENSEQTTLDRHLYDNQEPGGQSGDRSSLDHSTLPHSAPPHSTPPHSTTAPPRDTKDILADTGAGTQTSEPSANQPSPLPSDQDSDGTDGDSPPPDPTQQGQPRTPQPAPLSPTEREALAVQWQQRLAGAAQQALQAGKLGVAMARLVDHLLQPRLPWRRLLAHHVSHIARDDYSYARPNRRRGNPAIYPSLRSAEADLVVVLDTSGSISDLEMHEFLAEVNVIKSQLRARIVFHACDSALAAGGPWIFEPWENFELPSQLSGGGATDFTPVFAWVEQLDRPPRLLVYFTDAAGKFPAVAPVYDVIWLVKGRAPVPWGQRVQLN